MACEDKKTMKTGRAWCGLVGDLLAHLGHVKNWPEGDKAMESGQGPGIRESITWGACGRAAESELSISVRPLRHLGALFSLV